MAEREAARVDALGLLCPLPVLRLARSIGEVAVGDTVVLIADDQGLREDLAAWCAGNGHRLVRLAERAGARGPVLEAWVQRGR